MLACLTMHSVGGGALLVLGCVCLGWSVCLSSPAFSLADYYKILEQLEEDDERYPDRHAPEIPETYRDEQDKLLQDFGTDELGKYYGIEVPFLLQELKFVPEWPKEELKLGQISGISVDANNDLVIFHRANRVWDENNQLFDENNVFKDSANGPIKEPTLLKLSAEGVVMGEAGANRFYLPHGVTADRRGNLWVTDVALHQVFKMVPGAEEPALTLGKAFEPAINNNDTERFCKPTDVAVAKNGNFFVADGYCNSRVLKYDSEGKLIGQFGTDTLAVPHSITLYEEMDLVCVADREHKRIVCFGAGIKMPESLGMSYGEIKEPTDSRIFAIDFGPNDLQMYGITEKNGFTVDFSINGQPQITEEWKPNGKDFSSAHDIAVSHIEYGVVYVSEVNPPRVWRFERDVSDQFPNRNDLYNYDMRVKDFLEGNNQYRHPDMDQYYQDMDQYNPDMDQFYPDADFDEDWVEKLLMELELEQNQRETEWQTKEDGAENEVENEQHEAEEKEEEKQKERKETPSEVVEQALEQAAQEKSEAAADKAEQNQLDEKQTKTQLKAGDLKNV